VTFSIARFAGLAAATLAVVCGLAAWPTWATAGADGMTALALAAGLSWVGAVVGYLPTAMASERYEARMQAAMIGVILRLLVTLAAAFSVIATGAAASRMAFTVGVGIDYVALLALETFVVLRSLRRPAQVHTVESGGPASA
jgi:hypothetical protein